MFLITSFDPQNFRVLNQFVGYILILIGVIFAIYFGGEIIRIAVSKYKKRSKLTQEQKAILENIPNALIKLREKNLTGKEIVIIASKTLDLPKSPERLFMLSYTAIHLTELNMRGLYDDFGATRSIMYLMQCEMGQDKFSKQLVDLTIAAYREYNTNKTQGGYYK